MPNLKAPHLGPLLHGLAVWLVADGLPVLEYIQKVLTDQNPQFDLNRFLIGLAAAVVTALISAGRNAGAVELKKDEAAWVKGTQQDGGDAVIATAHEVVPTDEPVIVLRGRPPLARDPRNVPADLGEREWTDDAGPHPRG